MKADGFHTYSGFYSIVLSSQYQQTIGIAFLGIHFIKKRMGTYLLLYQLSKIVLLQSIITVRTIFLSIFLLMKWIE